jgi:hypothetical protein
MAVNFKQKEFFAPILAAVNAVGTAAGAVAGVDGMVQARKQEELQEEQSMQQKKSDALNNKIAQESNKLQAEQNTALNKLATATANTPQTPTTTPVNTMATHQVANTLSMPKPAITKSYSVIRFKRKGFSTPPKLGALATEGNKLIEQAKNPGLVGAGMSAFGGVSGVMGSIQTRNGVKEAQQGLKQTIAANQQKAAEFNSQLSDMKSATADLQSSVNNFQKSYSEPSTIKFRQKNYAILGKVGGLIDRWNKSGAGRTVNGLGKVTRDVVRDNRGMLLGGVAMGAGTAIVGYGVNKGLQAKMKKDGIDMNAITKFQQDQQQQYANERQYSDPATTAAAETGKKEVFDKFGNKIFQKQGWGRAGEIAAHYGKEAVGPLSIGFTAMFEAPKIGGYFGERNKLKALSDMARANQGLAPLPSALQAKPRKPGEQPGVVKMAGPGQAPIGQQSSRQQRNYSAVGNWFKGVVNGAVNGVRGFGHAVRTQGATGVLDFTSKHLAQGGGLKGVSRFGNRLIETGKQNNSQFLQKAGNFVKNNPKTALAASIPVGFGAMSATFEKGEDMIKKPMEKIDPNAYAYEKFKESQIQ